MKPWDVFMWEFPQGKHPAIVMSVEARCGNPDLTNVNVLACKSHRVLRLPRLQEAVVDEADGLDRPTLCRCDLFFLAPKTELKEKKGSVTSERRREITDKIMRILPLLKS